MEKRNKSELCVECGARCCKYIATQIDTPDTKQEYDHIRWYLLHRDVGVFIDEENDWYLEFKAECESLEDDHRCGGYHTRPRICREYGTDDAEKMCEYESGESPYRHYFAKEKEFTDYLDSESVDWRYENS